MAKNQSTTENKDLNSKPIQYAKLAMFNKGMALLFALQAVGVVLLSNGRTAEITTQYLTADTLNSEMTGGQALAMATRHLFDLPVAYVLAAGLLVFAAGHLLAGTIQRRRYEQDLALGLNRWRWSNLGAGGGLLVLAIAMLSGIHQISVLLPMLVFSILGCGLVLMNEKLMVEHHDRKAMMSKLMCTLAVLCTLLPWIILALGVKGVIFYDGQLPTYLYGVYISGFVLTLTLMAVTYFRLVRRGRLADSLYAEVVYMVLGLVGMSFVTWQVMVGALLS